MAVPDLKPVKGMVILQFFGDEDSVSDANASYGATPYEDKTCLAQVVAAGPETNVKKGQIVMVRGYARQATKIDDDTVIVDSYSILAVVASTA
jgi:co-chaperonin GroES (HSP10)